MYILNIDIYRYRSNKIEVVPLAVFPQFPKCCSDTTRPQDGRRVLFSFYYISNCSK